VAAVEAVEVAVVVVVVDESYIVNANCIRKSK